MRHISLISSIIGILILGLLLYLSEPLLVDSSKDFHKLNDNQKVLVFGKVIKEYYSEDSKILILDNNLSLFCKKPCDVYLNKKISAIGKKDSFYNSVKISKILNK